MEISTLTARRPYIVRAIYEWLLDNKLTPHLLINLTIPGIIIPLEFIKGNQLILNISPNATVNLVLGNENISFQATFNGQVQDIRIPLAAVQAMYARENGVGTTFESETIYELENVNKEFNNQIHNEDLTTSESPSAPAIRLVDVKKTKKKTKTDPDDNTPSPSRRRSSKLHLIK